MVAMEATPNSELLTLPQRPNGRIANDSFASWTIESRWKRAVDLEGSLL
jgi:hypothetical protein